MVTITNDEELFRHAARARGRVVLITGRPKPEPRVYDPVAEHQLNLRSYL